MMVAQIKVIQNNLKIVIAYKCIYRYNTYTKKGGI